MVLQVGDPGRAEMAASQARMLDDDRIGQAALLLPLANQQLHAACVGQDRHQRHIRVFAGELRQVEGKAGADDHRVDAACERMTHVVLVFHDRLHDIHGDQPAAAGQLARPGNLPAECLEIRGVDAFLGVRLAGHVRGGCHQVGMVPAQVDRRDRADTAEAGNGAGKPAGGNTDSHATLDDWQQLLAPQLPWPKA